MKGIPEIGETVLHDILRDLEVHAAIAVDDDIPESGHSPHRRRKVHREPPVLGQAVEQLAAGLRLAQPFVGHDMRRHVERGLDGVLERLENEPSFPDVALNLCRPGQRPELLDARLDEDKLLSEKIEVGHGAASARRR